MSMKGKREFRRYLKLVRCFCAKVREANPFHGVVDGSQSKDDLYLRNINSAWRSLDMVCPDTGQPSAGVTGDSHDSGLFPRSSMNSKGSFHSSVSSCSLARSASSVSSHR